MRKNLMMFGAASLLAGMLIAGGCGSSDDTTTAATTTTTAATTTTTTAAATTTTTGATTTTTGATTTTTTVPLALNVTGAGSDDASTAVRTYSFAAGTYTYTIAGFGAGDVLTFPAGVTPTVVNSSFTDGNVTVQWASGGNVISVVLTGQLANELNLNSIADFNTVFGAGTI